MKIMKKKIAVALLSLLFSVGTILSVLDSNADEINNTGKSSVGIIANSSEINEGLDIEIGVKNSDEFDTSNFTVEEKLDSNFAKKNINANIIFGADRISTAVKVSRQGWNNGSENVIIVNSKNTLLGIVATPLASLYNAPILITNSNSIDANVLSELKRLSPKNVLLIGDRDQISKSVSDAIKNVTGAEVDRIFGSKTSELSLAVAKKISSIKKVDTVYIASSTNGVADALSISSKAGNTKNPIIIVEKNNIISGSLSYLKSNISTAFYIGGTNSISNSLVGKINSVVKNAGNNNRIYGNDRHDTNVKVIDRFYKNNNLGVVVVTKSDNQGLIDTVCAGPFASLYESPIVITPKHKVVDSTSNLLDIRTATEVYQIGGGISQTVTNLITKKLSAEGKEIIVQDKEVTPVPTLPNNTAKPESNNNKDSNNQAKPDSNLIIEESSSSPTDEEIKIIGTGIKGKTIVIDPGHGGQDSGAVGLYGVKEKDWTLKTAIACANYLRAAGADVVMTRETDTYPSLKDRADITNNSKAVFFCSIHYNKGGTVINKSTGEQNGNGVEVFAGDGSSANTVARNVLNSILNSFNLRTRGVKDGTHLYVIANTVPPAILVEGGFVSNSRDVSLLNSDAALKRMGEQIAKGIIASFNGTTIR